MFDARDVVLVSIESSRSGMSDCVDICDWVDSLVDALEVLEAFDERDVRPFLAFGRLDGAVVPAKMKNGQSCDLR